MPGHDPASLSAMVLLTSIVLPDDPRQWSAPPKHALFPTMRLLTILACTKLAIAMPPPHPHPPVPAVALRAMTLPMSTALPAAKRATPPPLAAPPLLSMIMLPMISALEFPPT